MYMENSETSKPLSSTSMENERSTNGSSFEESGWTTYFEDFFATNNNNLEKENASYLHIDQDGTDDQDQYYTSSSLISDAASLVARNSGCHLGEQVVGLPIPRENSNSRLSFKKRRTKGGVSDNALEDTASSPVNSPKVYELVNLPQKGTRQKEKPDISHQEKGNGSNQMDGRSDLGLREMENDTTELRRRGLCLVPLSMVVNYIG